MGAMRFLVHPPERLGRDEAQWAYIAGPDLNPWRSRISFQGGTLQIDRAVADSGNVYVPWNVEGYGLQYLSTAALMTRSKPYQLPVELARGTINLLRNQLFEWQSAGMAVPESLRSRVHSAVMQLAAAVTNQQDPATATGHAERAIQHAVSGGIEVVKCFIDQALAARRQSPGNQDRMFGVRLDSAPLTENAQTLARAVGTAAIVQFNWRDIEQVEEELNWGFYDQQVDWCRAAGLRICGGPLLKMDDQALPNWLCLWEGNFDQLVQFVTQHVERTVLRYRGKVDVWQCAARVNLSDSLSLSEEERLRLTVLSIETVRRADPQTPVVLFFDQPWAEYMSRQDVVLSPFDFADAIVRAGIGLSGLGLEFNVGYRPGGCLPRSMLAFNRLLDHWSMLGLPLYTAVTVPSADGKCPQTRGGVLPLSNALPGGWSDKVQQIWGERLIGLMLSKPSVQGVFWNSLADGVPHEFPHGGLFDDAGRPKPFCDSLVGLRRAAFGG
ncbi:MAG: endo-1,4-beta-xylanase [Pirellulales bacterium]